MGKRRKPDAQTLLETRVDAGAIVGALLRSASAKRKGSSIKALTLAASVKHKKATHAVVMETIKHVRTMKVLFRNVGGDLAAIMGAGEGPGDDSLNADEWRARGDGFVYAYELLFGTSRQLANWRGGDGGDILAPVHVDALTRALEKAMAKAKVTTAEAFAERFSPAAGGTVRYSRTARVNTLKVSVHDALHAFREGGYECAVDGLIDTLLVFPAGTDLHAHSMVKDGRVVLQGRASCLPAAALNPAKGWACIDGCAAPGNKTTQLAAMVGKEGGVYAFDADAQRLKRLKENAMTTGSHGIIRAKCQDFLTVDPEAETYASVRALLLDPSCSGSGTEVNRGDIMLRHALGDDSHDGGDKADDESDDARIDKLAAFQKSALTHAFKFPEVERISYSTCSVHIKENEEVVRDVMDAAKKHGFRLAHALPKWHRRGIAIEGLSHTDVKCLIRADPMEDDMEGFFVAIFERDVERTKSKGAGLKPANPHNAAAANSKKRHAKDMDVARPVYASTSSLASSKKKKTKSSKPTPLFR